MLAPGRTGSGRRTEDLVANHIFSGLKQHVCPRCREMNGEASLGGTIKPVDRLQEDVRTVEDKGYLF